MSVRQAIERGGSFQCYDPAYSILKVTESWKFIHFGAISCGSSSAFYLSILFMDENYGTDLNIMIPLNF